MHKDNCRWIIEQDEREIDSLRATGEWDRLSESDRAFFESREPPTLAQYMRMMEVPAGIGTLSLSASGGTPRFNPWPWSVERDAHGLNVVVAAGEGAQDRAEVLFFEWRHPEVEAFRKGGRRGHGVFGGCRQLPERARSGREAIGG